MVEIQYFNGEKWINCGSFINENIAWMSLGGDNINYRVVNKETEEVLIDNSK